MLPMSDLQAGIAALISCLPRRENSEMEEQAREMMFARLLSDLQPNDFLDAVDEIILHDHWFPTVARIREAATAMAARRTRPAAQPVIVGAAPLVCPLCRGGRWVRLGGYDPLNCRVGEEGSRVGACPGCTTNGHYDPAAERRHIARFGGADDPDSGYALDADPDVPWFLPRRSDGTPDMDALYRQSRVLRGLDPDIDERPAAVPGWKSLRTMLEGAVA